MMMGNSFDERLWRTVFRTSSPLIPGISMSEQDQSQSPASPAASSACRPVDGDHHGVSVPLKATGQHVSIHLVVVDNEQRRGAVVTG